MDNNLNEEINNLENEYNENNSKFNITCVYDEKEAKKVSVMVLHIIFSKLVAIGVIFLGLGLLLLGVNLAIGETDYSWLSFYIIICALIILLFYFLPGLIIRVSKKIKGYVASYSFYEDKFKIIVKSEQENGIAFKNYSDLNRVVVKNGYIFIFIMKNSAYVIKIDNNSDKLIEILKNKVKKVITY